MFSMRYRAFQNEIEFKNIIFDTFRKKIRNTKQSLFINLKKRKQRLCIQQENILFTINSSSINFYHYVPLTIHESRRFFYAFHVYFGEG